MFLYVTAADAVDVVAQSERVNLMSELTFPQTRRCAAVYLIYSHFTASQENCHFDLTFGKNPVEAMKWVHIFAKKHI